MLSPTSVTPRNLLPSLRSLPTLSCPPELLPITILHSTLPALFSTSIPLFIREWFRIDPAGTPTAYSFSAFLVALGDLFVKLPLETVLRRGHVAYLKHAASADSGMPPTLPLHTAGLGKNKFRTIVPVGAYKGVLGTMLAIIHEEGYRESTLHVSRQGGGAEKRKKRGQGLAGLWRGWRVGVWALVGMCAALGAGGGGEL
jgi:mitochondrial fusion and transport protein UGO1